jgi:threonine aldolase
MSRRSFASDNNAGVHPELIEAIKAANEGHVVAYGNDPFTARATRLFQKHFGRDVAVYFVFGGTGANVLGLKAITNSYEAIICADTAHVHVDECGAPEKFTGCKLLTVPTPDGKLRVEQIKPLLHGIGVEHHVQPRVISISQATEMGTVYTKKELKTLADFAHEPQLLLHVDGAPPRERGCVAQRVAQGHHCRARRRCALVWRHEERMMYGEAVVFFDKQRASDFKFIRKQGTHLPSKVRFISAQFEALLSGDLWRRSATHANRMAQLLGSELAKVPQIKLTQPVESNGVFAIIPPRFVPALQKKYFFYVWDEEISEVRLMASFDTTEDDIRDFVGFVRKTVK